LPNPQTQVAPAPSLRGTEVDGALVAGDDGALVVGPDLRRFFDYFLSASGEEEPGVLAQRLRDEVDARLPADAAARARELLERYLTYRERARRLAESEAHPASLSDRWDAVRALRREVFGEKDAEALFGDEEAEVFVALAERGIGRDPALSAAEREEQRTALEAQLPEEARRAREEATSVLRLRREEASLRAAGAGVEEVRALREQQFGAAAADRLADLDRRRADWQRRVDDYRRARAAIDADVTLSPAERSRALADLLEESFSATERLRVEALDRIASGQADSGR
jgi:lipase chaperone LimK